MKNIVFATLLALFALAATAQAAEACCDDGPCCDGGECCD